MRIETFTAELKDGIIIGRFNVEYADLEIAKKAFEVRLKTSNNKSRPTLIDLRQILTFDKDAQHFLASDTAYQNIHAGALLVKSVYQKIAGNFFLFIKRHPIPTRIF